MFLNNLNKIHTLLKTHFVLSRRFYGFRKTASLRAKPQVSTSNNDHLKSESASSTHVELTPSVGPMSTEIFPTTSSTAVPLVLANKETVVLPFDEVPGPKSLKFLARTRSYLSEAGTQLTAGGLMLGLSIASWISNRKTPTYLTSLFDEYGPIVRFVSPVGRDIVLINNPDHIQKVFSMEGEHPVRSALDSLEKYRMEHRNKLYGGLLNVQGVNWYRQRALVTEPLQKAFQKHSTDLNEACNRLIRKIYMSRDYHDEINKDLYDLVHKWAFDCMGLLIFSKKFTMLDAEIVYSQCDMSWLYRSLEKTTEAILKCESGLQLWKLVHTPAWSSLVKYCDSLDNLIGKYVLEAEQKLSYMRAHNETCNENLGLINSLLTGEEKITTEDIATILMDMLLIGINTISTSMSFMMYNLAKHQKAQKLLSQEIENVLVDRDRDQTTESINTLKQKTPYLRACIKENLRLVPPIPILNRVLSKNITLDKYNIPRGTLIIMSTQDASLKESNYDDASKFYPERWLKVDTGDYHAFASIPFGFGARKCLGQAVAENMMAMLTMKLVKKFKLEYHYGDIQPTRSFIVKPNKPLKIRPSFHQGRDMVYKPIRFYFH